MADEVTWLKRKYRTDFRYGRRGKGGNNAGKAKHKIPDNKHCKHTKKVLVVQAGTGKRRWEIIE
jgi:hypothetical protein